MPVYSLELIMAKVDGDFESAGWTKPPSIPFRLAAGMEARELLAYLHQGPWQDIGATAPELWSSMTTTPPHPPWPCHHQWAFTLFLICTLVRRTEVPSWIELKPSQTPLPWDWAISPTPLLVADLARSHRPATFWWHRAHCLPRLCGGVWCLPVVP